jgi:hypothetical protein
MTAVMLIGGGATSTGALAAFVVKNSFKTNRNHPNKRTWRRTK